MPNIKSAKKRVLVNEKKNAVNKGDKAEVKTALKKINQAIDSNNIEEAKKLLPETVSVIDVSCKKGIYHKNTASNKKARLSKKVAAMSDVKEAPQA